jgi:basic membrane lipoprotein Med (substrate-binding protein (PBP1-ABC) superfamily)
MGHTAVKLSNEIMNEAGKYALTYARSIPMQIEHWARIGKIAEENPDLPYAFIEDVLKGKAEIDNGNVSLFEFRLE